MHRKLYRSFRPSGREWSGGGWVGGRAGHAYNLRLPPKASGKDMGSGPAPGFMRLTPDSRAPAKVDPAARAVVVVVGGGGGGVGVVAVVVVAGGGGVVVVGGLVVVGVVVVIVVIVVVVVYLYCIILISMLIEYYVALQESV